MSLAKLSKAEAGRLGARTRWGEPRVIRLDDLTADKRRLVLAFVEMARVADTKSEAAPTGENVGAATAEVQRGSAERSAA